MSFKKEKNSLAYILESGSLAEWRAYKKTTQNLEDFYWREYLELSSQREAIKDSLLESLQRKCIADYSFSCRQRVVKYRYSFHPLSCVGSMNFIGQRFNYGKDIKEHFTPFPALYLAEDKDTALQEVLGQGSESPLESGLSPQELALTNKESVSIVSVSGNLERVFDLRNSKSLGNFLSLIKTFKLSRGLRKEAQALKIENSTIIKKPKMLWGSIMNENWQEKVIVCNVPANSQIFGYFLNEARISGVIYKSKLTKKDCLAVFPDVFKDSNNRIWLDDPVPHTETPTQINSDNSIVSRMDFNEIVAIKKGNE